MEIFIIADTHFNHARLVELQGRPKAFDRMIVENWNRVVDRGDLVIHLGDVVFGRDPDVAALNRRLHGRKILCLGNHDRQDPLWYMERGFAFACTYFVLQGVVYSHKPVTPLPPGTMLNVHGHFHKSEHRDVEYRDNDFFQRHRSRYRLVQIEDTLGPVPLAEVLGGPLASESRAS